MHVYTLLLELAIIAKYGNPLDQNHFNISNIQAIRNSIPALEGDSVTFSCLFGLKINGSNISTCKGDGKWEPDPRKMECIGKFIATSIKYS